MEPFSHRKATYVDSGLLFVSSNVGTRHNIVILTVVYCSFHQMLIVGTTVILFCSCDWIETEKAASNCSAQLIYM